MHARNASIVTTLVCIRRLTLDIGRANEARDVPTQLYSLAIINGPDTLKNIKDHIRPILDEMKVVQDQGVRHPNGLTQSILFYGAGDMKW